MGFVVLHMEKAHGSDSGTTAHIERFIIPKNADPTRTHLNRRLIEYPDGVKDRSAAIQQRLEEAGLTRKIGSNQVRAIRINVSGTHEDMKRIEEEGRLDEWCADNLKYFADTFGKENIVAAHLHRDEETPHIHVTLVPIVKGERKRRKREERTKKRYRKKPTDTVRLCADDIMTRLKLKGPNSARGSLLGRETALQKITWQDGWPRLACGGKIAQNAVPAPKDLPEVELPAMAEQDDFDVPALAPGYATPRTPLGDCVNLTVRPGWLRLTGQESMNSLHHVTLVARRQQEHEMQAETRMDFAPVCPEQMAGFTYCYDSMNFYLLGKTCAEDGTPVLELLKSDTGVVEDVCDPVPVPDGTLDFKLTTTPDGGMAQFYYRQPQGEWQSIGPACPTDILTDEHCRGFTGAHVGVYAHDMAGLHNHADFDYLNVHFER